MAIFENYPSTNTPLSADYLNSVLELMFPIGRVVEFETDNDYSNWLGFTWERTQEGVSSIGYDPDDSDFSTIGNTGGEKTHTLTISEMPKHRHSHRVEWGDTSGNVLVASGTDKQFSVDKGAYTGYTGGDGAHNNMHPYQVTAKWKRIA